MRIKMEKDSSFKNIPYGEVKNKWGQLWKNKSEFQSSLGRELLLQVYPPFIKDWNSILSLKRSLEPNDIDRVEKHWLIKANLAEQTFSSEDYAPAVTILYGSFVLPDINSFIAFPNTNLVNVQINLDQPEIQIIEAIKKLKNDRTSFQAEKRDEIKKYNSGKPQLDVDPTLKKMVLDESDLLIFINSIRGMPYNKIADAKAKAYKFREIHPTTIEKRFKESLLPFVDPFGIGSEQYIDRKHKQRKVD